MVDVCVCVGEGGIYNNLSTATQYQYTINTVLDYSSSSNRVFNIQTYVCNLNL